MPADLPRALATAAELAATMSDTNQPRGRRDYARIMLVRWIEDHAWMFAEAGKRIAELDRKTDDHRQWRTSVRPVFPIPLEDADGR